jgi:hypothetical protein
MSMIQPGLFALFERFTNQKSAIKAQYLQSDSLKTLCSDYKQCAAVIAHWKRCPGEEAAQRCKEYAALLAELEEEVRQILAESY